MKQINFKKRKEDYNPDPTKKEKSKPRKPDILTILTEHNQQHIVNVRGGGGTVLYNYCSLQDLANIPPLLCISQP